jgi:two-component system cell cycle sensor histidine kinase/response regulator CckA
MAKAKRPSRRPRPRPGSRSAARGARPGARTSRRLDGATFDAIFAGVGAGLCLLDPRDVVLRVNAAWSEATGVPASDAVGQVIWDLVPMPPDGIAALRALLARVRAGEPQPLPVVALPSGGREVWLEGRVTAIPLGRGVGALVTLHDITERKQVERVLRETEQRFRLALRNAPVAVAAKDRDLRYLWLYDPRAPTAEDALGKTDADLLPPEEAARLAAIERTVLEENVEVRDEGWFTRSTGRVYLDSFFEPIHDEAGRVVGVGTAGVDLTAMKLAEEALREREERLAVTLRSIGDAVIATDEAGRVAVLNAEAERLTGWSSAEAAGRPLQEVFQVIDEGTRTPAPSPVEPILSGGAAVAPSDPIALIARDGVERPIAERGAPIRDAAGRVAGVVLVFRDQTREREAERRLRLSEERLRVALEATDAGIWEWDLRGGDDFWSDNLWRLYGLEPGGQKPSYALWRSTVHPDEAQRLEQKLEEALRAGVEFEQEWRVADPRRGIRWLSTRGRPVRDADGTVGRYVGITLDVTAQHGAVEARRELEDQLRQAQKLESVGRLAGGVAHDFNNLLTVILSCVESLDEAVLAGRPAEPGEIDEIRSAGRRASELTRQLLAFARKQLIAPVALDLGAVVQESEKLLRRVLGEHIVLGVAIPPGLWWVRCDAGQLEQVVVNLAVNARDAMPQGGRLELELENVTLGEGGAPFPEAAPGEWVRLRVRDSGVGMSPDVKGHLFEPFFTTKPQGSGTGLGLATTYGIVRQSGGGIHVESEQGRGATFDVYLPRTLEAPPAASAARPASTGGTEAVLVVEDEPLVRDVTVRALRGAGYRVTVAEHPQRALELPVEQLRELRLLVTDVVMPGIDGRALAEELRRRHAALRVLYVSGYTQDALAERGVVDTGIEFLPKPFTPSLLLGRVREVLDAPARAPAQITPG